MNTCTTPQFLSLALLSAGLLSLAGPAHAGNFVGDGHDDLLVGAPGEALGVGPRSGAAFLYRGYGYGMAGVAVLDQGGLDVDELGDEFGSAFACGDFDGDGELDLAIGAPGEVVPHGPRSGAVFVYSGTGAVMEGAGLRPALMLDQSGLGLDEWGDRLGESMVAADFDGDGFDDLAVGAPGEGYGPTPAVGAVVVYRGSPIGLVPGQILDQSDLGLAQAGDLFGSALAAGDFDGDGLFDLAVGAPGEDVGEARSAGLVYVFGGTTTGLVPDFVLNQAPLGAEEAGDWFGAALRAGDFDGDGYQDLAVGAPGEAPGDAPNGGAVFVFRGGPASLIAEQVLSQRELDHVEAGDQFGAALTSGDYNGDGRDELAVGAPGENLPDAPDSGAVYVFRGDRSELVPLQRITQAGLGSDERFDQFGAALASGDFLGDSRRDLAIAAPGETRGSAAPSGSVYLYRGTALGLLGARQLDQYSLERNEAGDMFGAALSD